MKRNFNLEDTTLQEHQFKRSSPLASHSPISSFYSPPISAYQYSNYIYCPTPPPPTWSRFNHPTGVPPPPTPPKFEALRPKFELTQPPQFDVTQPPQFDVTQPPQFDVTQPPQFDVTQPPQFVFRQSQQFDLSQPPPRINVMNSQRPQLAPVQMNTQYRMPNMRGIRGGGRSGYRIYRGVSLNTTLRQKTTYTVRNNVPNLSQNNTGLLLPSTLANGENGEKINVNNVQVNKKSKRKPMSSRYTRAKEWEREDALKAINLENEYNKLQKTPTLILKFPDPELSKFIVKKYSPFIEQVHFQQPSTARYCFIQVKEGADIEKVRRELCEIPFGTGKITAERKFTHSEENQPVTPEEIDPYTLYIGNLPTQISVKTVKENFPKATRIDIGYAQRMKYTRYAFIRYNSIEDSMEAYKHTFNTLIGNRSLIVRFRRSKGNIGLPGDSRMANQRKEILNTVESPSSVTPSAQIDVDSGTNDLADITSPDTPNNAAEDLPISEELEEDTKINVLSHSRKISTNINEIFSNEPRKKPRNEPEDGLTIKHEPTDKSLINSDEEEEGAVNLLGTRIKDEPPDDDELLASAQCYEDMDDDEFDCEEPEEEDDILPNSLENNLQRSSHLFNKPPPSTSLTSPQPKPQPEHSKSLQVQSHNSEEYRQAELNREETKPNVQILSPFDTSSIGLGFSTRNALDTNSWNSTPNIFDKNKKSSMFSFDNKEDSNDDIFDDMNPEEDDDNYI